MNKTKVIIIGASFGGIGMAVALQTAGIHDFLLLERGEDVGGAWRINRYPGCRCDTPSHLYSFSFAPYQQTDKRYPPGDEIMGYLKRVADDYGLQPHLRLGNPVVEATWKEEEHLWEVVSATGNHFVAEHVVFAVGQLPRPNHPIINGLDNFKGPVMHTAEWDESVELHDKNVAIIGTGSTAAQMLSPVASTARSVTVYQRTPAWVLPKPSDDFGSVSRAMLQIPGFHGFYRNALHYGADMLLSPITRSKGHRALAEWFAERYLQHQIQDKELLEKLKPSYPLGSKRILLDSTFYPALNCKNVELVAETISQATPTSIETENSSKPIDVIICATGFKTSEILLPITVRGRNGHNLNADWKSGAEAFMGLAIRGYPNLFVVSGPNSFNPAGSNPMIEEHQAEYIVRCLRWMDKVGVSAVEVSEEAMVQYREVLEAKMQRTIWSKSEVNSWFKHEGSGKVTHPWPGSARAFMKMLKKHPRHSFVAVH